jgi:hypothetical protein
MIDYANNPLVDTTFGFRVVAVNKSSGKVHEDRFELRQAAIECARMCDALGMRVFCTEIRGIDLQKSCRYEEDVEW